MPYPLLITSIGNGIWNSSYNKFLVSFRSRVLESLAELFRFNHFQLFYRKCHIPCFLRRLEMASKITVIMNFQVHFQSFYRKCHIPLLLRRLEMASKITVIINFQVHFQSFYRKCHIPFFLRRLEMASEIPVIINF